MLNTLHGLISTALAIQTLVQSLDTTNVCAASISYFVVDFLYMAQADGFSTLFQQPNSRKLDYIHHVFGSVWGIVLHYTERWVCVSAVDDGGSAMMINAYVWIQTNEVSTPFYNWYRMTRSTTAGVLFALSFFASRIVFNTLVLMPKFYQSCNAIAFAGCFPYFILQYIWFLMIVRKVTGLKVAKD